MNLKYLTALFALIVPGGIPLILLVTLMRRFAKHQQTHI